MQGYKELLDDIANATAEATKTQQELNKYIEKIGQLTQKLREMNASKNDLLQSDSIDEEVVEDNKVL